MEKKNVLQRIRKAKQQETRLRREDREDCVWMQVWFHLFFLALVSVASQVLSLPQSRIYFHTKHSHLTNKKHALFAQTCDFPKKLWKKRKLKKLTLMMFGVNCSIAMDTLLFILDSMLLLFYYFIFIWNCFVELTGVLLIIWFYAIIKASLFFYFYKKTDIRPRQICCNVLNN